MSKKKSTTTKARKTGDKLLKAALATTAANIARIEAAERGEKNGKADAKPARPKKQKRMSALDAAAQVLGDFKKPMNSQDLIKAMVAGGLWTSPGGKTPHATLYAAMTREIGTKGSAARFVKKDRGLFASNK